MLTGSPEVSRLQLLTAVAYTKLSISCSYILKQHSTLHVCVLKVFSLPADFSIMS